MSTSLQVYKSTSQRLEPNCIQRVDSLNRGLVDPSAPIDAVVLWVDGSDPVWRAKRDRYLLHGEDRHDDIAGPTRYTSVGEVYYCIASINRFAPFVRRIFLVTDHQVPSHLDDFLRRNFPDGYIPYEVIDHTVIFRGHEDCLPTFNCNSIEPLLWRIPGLSERYIYFNDDIVLLSPVTPDDFFVGEATRCYGRWYSTSVARLLHALKPRRDGHKPMGFKSLLVNTLRYTPRPHRRFLFLLHTPLPLRRSFFDTYLTAHPEVLRVNITQRFRHPSQFNPQELFYLTEHPSGRCLVTPSHANIFYYKPHRHSSTHYLLRKEREFRRSSALFGCFNSLDQAPDAERQRILQLLTERLRLEGVYESTSLQVYKSTSLEMEN